MYKKTSFFFMVSLLMIVGTVNAQYQSYRASGELGVSAGTSQYFGDIDPSSKLKPNSYSLGSFYQKYFNNYIGLKLSVNYAKLHASDADDKNEAYKSRNLNFTNNIIELSLAGSFNFFNYAPGFSGHNFTPYVSLGVGAVYTNPFTTLNGKKVFLRPLGTEGQKSLSPHDGKKYGPFAMVFPLSIGVRQAINEKINLFAEIGYRFTNTDYLDDVSSTYAGLDAFSLTNYKGTAAQAALAQQLQDRSSNQNVGKKGWQRGNSLANDSYMFMQVGISYNFSRCNCPQVF